MRVLFLLLDLKYKVTVIDSLKFSSKSINHLFNNDNFNFIEGDIRNKKIMKKAKPNAIFMHCLPANRGEEVTNEVINGKQSVVWSEALNRIHVQKSIIEWCLR